MDRSPLAVSDMNEGGELPDSLPPVVGVARGQGAVSMATLLGLLEGTKASPCPSGCGTWRTHPPPTSHGRGTENFCSNWAAGLTPTVQQNEVGVTPRGDSCPLVEGVAMSPSDILLTVLL